MRACVQRARAEVGVRVRRRAGLLALGLLALAGCGAQATPLAGAPTPTATFVPAAVVGSVTTIHMFDAATGWAATVDRLLRTSDGGGHWRDVTPPAPAWTSQPHIVAFPRSASDAWVVRVLMDAGPGASESLLSHTTDGGRSWRASMLPIFAVAQITFADAEHGWMLADVDTAQG